MQALLRSAVVGMNVQMKPEVAQHTEESGLAAPGGIGGLAAISNDGVVVDFLEQPGWKGKLCDIQFEQESGSVAVGARAIVRSDVAEPRWGWGSIRSRTSAGDVTKISSTEVWIDFPEQSNWHGLLSEIQVLGPVNAVDVNGATALDHLLYPGRWLRDADATHACRLFDILLEHGAS